jgi:hypothetical protein
MVIKVLYCVFLAVLTVLFVAWAMAALYPSPRWETEYPGISEYGSQSPDKPTATELAGLSLAEKKAKLQAYGAKQKKYQAEEKEREKSRKALQEKTETRGRNVSLISLDRKSVV